MKLVSLLQLIVHKPSPHCEKGVEPTSEEPITLISKETTPQEQFIDFGD